MSVVGQKKMDLEKKNFLERYKFAMSSVATLCWSVFVNVSLKWVNLDSCCVTAVWLGYPERNPLASTRSVVAVYLELSPPLCSIVFTVVCAGQR